MSCAPAYPSSAGPRRIERRPRAWPQESQDRPGSPTKPAYVRGQGVGSAAALATSVKGYGRLRAAMKPPPEVGPPAAPTVAASACRMNAVDAAPGSSWPMDRAPM